MILRRPYAFLIKHFKLFHLILTAITAYLLKSSITILQFFTSYMATNEVLYYEDYSTQLFSKWMFILPIFMLIVIGIVLTVLIRKKKPTIFYFICIGMAIVTYVLFNISMDTVITMESEIVTDQKVGLLRDFLMFSIIVQAYAILINFIRGIGFDVKKFDFGKDLQELDASEEDNEEVEVSINVDTNKINRKFRRGTRFARYNYIEHQLVYNIGFVTVGVLFIGFVSYLFFKEDEKYRMNETFYTENYAITVKNAYVTSTDYKGNILELGKRFIVLEVDISTLIEEKVLDPRNIQVIINDHSYYHIQKYKEEFFDLGAVYMGEKLNFDTQTFIFLYEVYDYANTSSISFRFAENYENAKDRLDKDYINLNLDVKDLDLLEVIDMDLKEELIIDNTIFKDSKINIDSLLIGNKFKINYKKKVSNGEYYDSIEYITPKIDENYDKGLLKLDGKLELSNKEAGISKFTTFANKFSYISYNFNGEERKFNFKSYVDSDKVVLNDTYYLEFKKEILYSTDIYLEFRFRNKIYRYAIDEVEA